MFGDGVLLAEFWILDPLYTALGAVLAWSYAFIPSFGVAIILLTIAVRLMTFPLTAKQARSQQALQKLQPELKRLQAKHKGDRQKLNEEMMKFYKENKVNPFGGCLPLLIQLPILIVLYRLILGLSSIPPKHVPKDSALFDALVESGGKMPFLGMDLSETASSVAGSKLPYLLLIAIVVATGYYQQRQISARLPKDGVNAQMQMITKVFPVFFGLISFSIPAGVVVYFATSNIWQIGQQAFIFRNQPPPPNEPEKKKTGEGKGSGVAKRAPGPGGKGAPTPKRSDQRAKGPGGRGKQQAKGAKQQKTGTARGGATPKDKGVKGGATTDGASSRDSKRPERPHRAGDSKRPERTNRAGDAGSSPGRGQAKKRNPPSDQPRKDSE